MLLKYLGSVLPAQDGENRVVAAVWSANNLKLAVALSNRSIYLFDEKGIKKDKFSTKPIDPKYGKKSYVIKGIAFSPDSTKIAVGQTDNIAYVYRIGEEWGEKKVICNKFSQTAAVTCLIWPSEGPIVVGLADGKVRAAILKANKGHTLYASDSMTISLAVNVKGTGFLSGHADGSIIRYYVSEDGQAEPPGRVVTHGVPAYALAWPLNHIFAGGCDKRISFYDPRGKLVRNFDYSREEEEREMTVACCSPSGQSVAVGSWDKVRLLDWSPRRGIWEEANTRVIKNLYTVTALAWRRDGSRLIVGGLCGAVEQFESILRRTIVRGSHEVAYVGPSQVVVRPLNGTSRPIVIRSQTGSEIEDVRVLGRRDNHIVARTSTTLLVSDIELNLLSEIPWEVDKNGNEKFFLEYPGVCLIFCAGELTVVEYGKSEILCSVRTEAVNPHVVSIRINERQAPGSSTDNKRLAYLLDPRTVCVIDLVTHATISVTIHDARVDWLELSETGHRVLSRDRRGRLWLSDDRGGRSLLLAGASFASWVPGSDVAVAQTGSMLAVWYNVDAPEATTLIPIKGDAIDIVRESGSTRVMVEESGGQVGYLLDEGLIEFGTALHDNDFGRAVLFLENLGDGTQAEAMWENVASNSMAARQFSIAARCYAALGDFACSNFLNEIVKAGEKYSLETGNDALANPDCWAKLAILNGELKTAEAIYLEQNELDKALDMYQKYWHWEDALALAQNRGWAGLDALRDNHLSWLLESRQGARAAAIIEPDNPRLAVTLYLEAHQPGKAARLLLANEELIEDGGIVGEVIAALKKADLMELAGEIFEKSGEPLNAIKFYSQAGAFARALELVRNVEPNSVVSLEREWGHHLAAGGHYDAAINHFIESGETALALDAAIKASQWRKALQIVQVIENDDPEIQKHCGKLGEYFASIGDREMAETLFLRAGETKRAIETDISSGDWGRAYEVATNYLSTEEANEVLAKHAEAFQQAGDLKQAEALYLAIDQFDLAIAMYRREGHRGDMVRLVRKYRPELLQATHAHLAKELEAAGKPREAEEHFIGNGDWRGAVAAYRAANMWEDALRVAKQVSGEKAAHQVALMWARTLAPELSARLLVRLDYFEPCLQLACEANMFDWALEIAKYGTSEQMKEVHYKYAMALEDEGRFSDAEKEFVLADKAMEAVQMYIHTRDWDAAEEVAQTHHPDGLPQVLISRAADAAQAQDYALAESLLLRAHKPDIIINHYKKAGMLSEAMRVCREYLPSQEAALRRELTQISSGLGITGSGGGSLEEARRWLAAGEVRAAIDVLILDPKAPKAALVQAADILVHQADNETAVQIGEDLGNRLIAVGEYALAAQVFLQADKLRHAVDALAIVGEWGRAKRIVKELAPELEPYLDEKYREAMIREGHVDQLVEVDTEAALEILARKGQWSQVFEAAGSQSEKLLHKYVAQRAAQLLKSGSTTQALQLYVEYGAPPLPQNYNLYYHLSELVLGSKESSKDYKTLSQLRNVLLGLIKSMESTSSEDGKKFDRVLHAAHYFSLKLACKDFSPLASIVTKVSISLLRYSDILPADRCYYEAGINARAGGLISEAFIFFNHFLDLEECIEEGDGGLLDVEDLKVTDFPVNVPLPSTLSLSAEEREEVREWVLAVSMDQKVEQGLPMDQRGVYIGSLTSPSNTAEVLQACFITGYPIRGPVINFEGSNQVADREDWNKLVSTARQAHQDSELNDLLLFVQEFCGSLPSYYF